MEGVDKTGKTTLAEILLKKYPGAILIKQNRKSLPNLKEVFRKMLKVLSDLPGEGPIILDRFYPSQMVYSILRDEEDLDNLFYKMFENILVQHDSLAFEIIYCTADDKTIKRRFEEDNEEYVKQDQIALLKRRYETFIYDITKLKYSIQDTSW